MKEASISMYADDSYVKEEERLTQLCKDSSLQVNCDKYQCMLLGCENTERTINFAIDGEHIQQTQSIKILGVLINEKLTFGVHISKICKRVSKHIGVFNRPKNLIPTRAKLQLFKKKQ